MAISFDGKLVVAVSSRALFDLDASHQVYEQQGLAAYEAYQREHENEPLKPGDAFSLVNKLLRLNDHLTVPGVEVILLSRNSSDTGLRVFNSIREHNLPITRAVFCGGTSPHRYVPAFGAHLFLSTNPADVRASLEAGFAAATILGGGGAHPQDAQLRIAFDGDAVLFSDESERIFQEQGLEAFAANELNAATTPLHAGPFKAFLEALHHLQGLLDETNCPLRTALVTARSAPAHERVVRTFRAWNIRIDESLFLGGLPKAEFLRAFGADIFFDDQQGHCQNARDVVATGHVPYGISNRDKSAD